MKYTNIYNLFINSYHKNPTHTIFKYKDNSQWKQINRKQLLQNIRICSDILTQEYNIKSGDRIMYNGNNSIEWISWNLASHRIGSIWVPTYPKQSNEYYKHVIKDSSPKLLINDNNIDKIDKIDNNIDNIDTNIYKSYQSQYDNNYLYTISNNNEESISTLIYTSGTTGKPKGSMLTHKNIISNLRNIKLRFHDMDTKLTSVTILPWSHIYGMTCELYYNLLYDNTIVISSGKEFFINECKEIKPDILYVVPKILETIKHKFNLINRFNYLPFHHVIMKKILTTILGNNIKIIFVGGSYLNIDTLLFYENLGIKICQGYGCSETSPLISINHYQLERDITSIGKILNNIEVKIDKHNNNEILVSGDNVMLGYWNNQRETDKVLIKDINNKIWYRTGDGGDIDKYGYLYYQGRIKDNYKLNNGKFVNINEIENKIKYVLPNHNICVYTPNNEYNNLITDNYITKTELNLINQHLETYLKIQNIKYIDKDIFELFLTPKFSLKRKLFLTYLKDNKLINNNDT